MEAQDERDTGAERGKEARRSKKNTRLVRHPMPDGRLTQPVDIPESHLHVLGSFAVGGRRRMRIPHTLWLLMCRTRFSDRPAPSPGAGRSSKRYCHVDGSTRLEHLHTPGKPESYIPLNADAPEHVVAYAATRASLKTRRSQTPGGQNSIVPEGALTLNLRVSGWHSSALETERYLDK